nr:helix-turn-helix transcriptional regulator [Brevundimonas diminuta]
MVAYDNNRADVSTATQLSARERECLQWAGRGKSSSDIASILQLSPRTVDSYLEKACSKIGVRTRIEAVAAAVRRGIISSC